MAKLAGGELNSALVLCYLAGKLFCELVRCWYLRAPLLILGARRKRCRRRQAGVSGRSTRFCLPHRRLAARLNLKWPSIKS